MKLGSVGSGMMNDTYLPDAHYCILTRGWRIPHVIEKSREGGLGGSERLRTRIGSYVSSRWAQLLSRTGSGPGQIPGVSEDVIGGTRWTRDENW